MTKLLYSPQNPKNAIVHSSVAETSIKRKLLSVHEPRSPVPRQETFPSCFRARAFAKKHILRASSPEHEFYILLCPAICLGYEFAARGNRTRVRWTKIEAMLPIKTVYGYQERSNIDCASKILRTPGPNINMTAYCVQLIVYSELTARVPSQVHCVVP